MSHRSRLCAVFFDTPDAETSVAFWSAALNRSRRGAEADRGPYLGLSGGPGDAIDIIIQEIDEEPRSHVDIETDDVVAETARLVALGAETVSAIEDWQVLRAPGGHLFCVVPAHTLVWPEGSTEWPD